MRFFNIFLFDNCNVWLGLLCLCYSKKKTTLERPRIRHFKRCSGRSWKRNKTLQIFDLVRFPTVKKQRFISFSALSIASLSWFWTFLKPFFFSCCNVSLRSRMLTLSLMLPNIRWIMDNFFVCYMLIFIRNREKPSIKAVEIWQWNYLI